MAPKKCGPGNEPTNQSSDEVPREKAEATRWQREHFIPLRKAELIRLLGQDERLPEDERGQFAQLCSLLEAILHFEYLRCMKRLKDLYAPFNPDSVTKELRSLLPHDLERMAPEMFEEFAELLNRANYRRLTREEIEQATSAASDWGVRLRVDFDVFERLEMFARGAMVEQREFRGWRTFYRTRQVAVPFYQRLVLIVRMCDKGQCERQTDTRPIYLKVFKNVPRQDLDMLLPETRFRMTLLDRGKVVLPTVSGLALAMFKILKGVVVLAFAGVYGTLAVLALIVGTVGYGVKSFFEYLRTKDKYQLNLTRSLYYQNLDNNLGVLHRLFDEAEEQEFREAILAYALLRRRAGASGWSEQRLDEEAESYLSRILGFSVDFEVHDALDKLQRFGCATKTAAGLWQATPLNDSLVGLDRVWDGYFCFDEKGE
ncbi:MAG: TMEM143 family protein [Pirellulaceae bacterium]